MESAEWPRSRQVEARTCLVKVQTTLVIQVTGREHGKTSGQRLTEKIGLGEAELVVGLSRTTFQVYRHVLAETEKIVCCVTQPQKAAGGTAHTAVESDAVSILFLDLE